MVLARQLYIMQLEMDTLYHEQDGWYLPQIPLHRARFVMTRSDFIRPLHNLSIFSINANALVSASSIPMQRAMSEVCSEPGFDEFLEATLERIGEIESLGRTKEITLKDLWSDGKYRISVVNEQGKTKQTLVVEKAPEQE
jgi:hypothetical protein